MSVNTNDRLAQLNKQLAMYREFRDVHGAAACSADQQLTPLMTFAVTFLTKQGHSRTEHISADSLFWQSRRVNSSSVAVSNASSEPMTDSLKDSSSNPATSAPCSSIASTARTAWLDSELPTDTYFVRYSKDSNEFASAFRAYKSADIFDPLCDAGYQVLEITYGFGRIKPKLYGIQKGA